MLQKMKEIGGKVYAVCLETVKSHYRSLLCLALVISSLLLSGAHYSLPVRAESVNETVNPEIFKAEYIGGIKKPAIEESEFKPTSVVNNLVADTTLLSYIFPVEVKAGGKVSTYLVYSGSVKEILDSIGITLDSFDTTDKPLNSIITGETSIEITDIDYATEILLEAIPFGFKTEYSNEYAAASTVVIEGEEGQKETVLSLKYVNGVVSETTVISEEIVKQASDQVTIIGTALESGEAVPAASANTISQIKAPEGLLLDQNGLPVNYSHSIVAKATAYTHTGHNCSTGVAPMPGYIAVDPREIPYGTRMYIVSADGRYVYGYAIAADTGGFIHNSTTGVDLFFDTRGECISFGRRDVIIYFV